jgi:hypothetical protein
MRIRRRKEILGVPPEPTDDPPVILGAAYSEPISRDQQNYGGVTTSTEIYDRGVNLDVLLGQLVGGGIVTERGLEGVVPGAEAGDTALPGSGTTAT